MANEGFDLVWLGRFDDRLKALVEVLNDAKQQGRAHAEARQLVADYANAENVANPAEMVVAPEKLFSSGWESRWLDYGDWWPPLAFEAFLARLEADALYGVCRTLIEYAVDATTSYHRKTIGAKLAETIQNYRGRRGYDTVTQWDHEPEGPKPTGGKPKTKPTVDDRMKAELAANLETVKGWTAQQWANQLECGKTSVVESQTWKSLSLLRQQAKAERRNDRRRK